MIQIENVEVIGWEAAIRGMRNPMNSWNKSDSGFVDFEDWDCGHGIPDGNGNAFVIGDNDLRLMKCLRNAGADHRKFMRMITVYADITAPLYFWKEFDQYKVGTTTNSCSTMHKIHAKEFALEDFSHEHLIARSEKTWNSDIAAGPESVSAPIDILTFVIDVLNIYREQFIKTKDKRYWWQMIQILPSSYNQKRTVMMNYEVLANIYKSRKNHKLDEWAEHKESTCTVDSQGNCRNPKEYLLCEDCSAGKGFCDWIKTLPYAFIITRKESE